MRADLADVARQAVRSACATYEKVYLAFSGGRDSVVLAHMALPFADKVHLLWTNTGMMFPHMVDFVRGYGVYFRLVELTSDVASNWEAYGMPAEIAPVENILPDRANPLLQPWLACCAANRTKPMFDFLRAGSDACVLHGQRHTDKARNLGIGVGVLSETPNVVAMAPLADWTDADVQDYIIGNGLTLPEQYAAGADSLECSLCPASFTGDKGRRRVAYMAARYPHELGIALAGARRGLDAGRVAVTALADDLAEHGRIAAIGDQLTHG